MSGHCSPRAYRTAACALLSSMALLGTHSHAAEISTNDGSKLQLSGQVNGGMAVDRCNAMAEKNGVCGGTKARTAFQGLNLSTLSFQASTHLEGTHVGTLISVGTHTDTPSTEAGNTIALSQALVLLGSSESGQLKIGRDVGLFSQEVMTAQLLSQAAGFTPQELNAAHDEGLFGYATPGRYGQITYTSPTTSTLQFGAGIFAPSDSPPTADNGTNTPSKSGTAGVTPQVQAHLSWHMLPGSKLWIGGKAQTFEDMPKNAGNGFTMAAAELGSLVQIGGLKLLANGQYGKGLGFSRDGEFGNLNHLHVTTQASIDLSPTWTVGGGLGVMQAKKDDNERKDRNAVAFIAHQWAKPVHLLATYQWADLSQSQSADSMTLHTVFAGAKISL